METDILKISSFIEDEILSVTELRDGHINDTFLVETASGKYVAQRLSKNMDKQKIEYNYNLYSEVFEGCGWLYPRMIKDKMGMYFSTDSSDANWRMYKYLEATVLDASMIASIEEAQAKEIIYAYGKGLAELHSILRMIQNKPKAVYPNLHDLKKFYEEYLRIKYSKDLNEISRDYDLEEQLENLAEYHIKQSEALLNGGIEMILKEPGESILKELDEKVLKEPDKSIRTEKNGTIFSIIHGDPKISNVLFNDGKVVGFLDLDTIMWGSLLDDIADAIRSCCIIDGKVSSGLMESFMDGYKSEAPEEVAEIIDNNLHEAFAKICVELALRYYMDEISGAGYFKEKYPGYRIKRTRELLELVM